LVATRRHRGQMARPVGRAVRPCRGGLCRKRPPLNIFTPALQYADTSGLLSCRRTVVAGGVGCQEIAEAAGTELCGLAVALPGARRSEVHPDFDTSTFERLITIPKLLAIRGDVDTDPCLGLTPIAEQNPTTKAFRHASQSEVKTPSDSSTGCVPRIHRVLKT
jgi:hypothetical protein